MSMEKLSARSEGERETDAAAFAVVHQSVAKLVQPAVVARAEREERDLVVAGEGERFLAVLHALFHAAAAHRAVNVSGLAEPASADAAAEELKTDAVVHDLRGGDDRVHGEAAVFKVRNNALRNALRRTRRGVHGLERAVAVILRRIEGRDVHAADERGAAEKFRLAPTGGFRLAQKLQNFAVHALALADDHKIEKVRHRLAVAANAAAGKHERREAGALGAAQRNAGQIEHFENGRIRHLVAERKADRVKLAERVAAFERVEGETLFAHLPVHIKPGSEHALAPYAGKVVEHLIENAHAGVRHADLIRVREAERHAEINFTFIFLNFAVLTAGVPGGLLYEREDPFKFLVHTSKLLHRVCVECTYIL